MHSLSMRVKAGVGEALSLILSEEARVAQSDVVDLVPGAAPVQPMPVLLRRLSLPGAYSDHGIICTIGTIDAPSGAPGVTGYSHDD